MASFPTIVPSADIQQDQLKQYDAAVQRSNLDLFDKLAGDSQGAFSSYMSGLADRAPSPEDELGALDREAAKGWAAFNGASGPGADAGDDGSLGLLSPLSGRSSGVLPPVQAAQSAPNGPAPAPQSGGGFQQDVGGLVPAQYNDKSLSAGAANAACGPAAAVAFARANGRNPTLAEATQLAQSVGWTPNSGMAGAASEQALMSKMGISTRLESNPNWNAIQQDASNGNPVAISTPQHYFVVDGYDPQRGAYHVGNSGTAVQVFGGSPWMTAGQIASAGRGINGVLYADHPLAQGPSTTETPQPDPTQHQMGGELGDQPDQSGVLPSVQAALGMLGGAIGGAASDLGGAVQSGMSAVTGIDPNQPVGPDNQGIGDQAPAAQAAVQGAPQAVMDAATDPLAAAVQGVNAVNAASGSTQPAAPTPSEAAQPVTTPVGGMDVNTPDGTTRVGQQNVTTPGLLTPPQATAATVMGGLAAGGPEGIAAPVAGATDLARAGARAAGPALNAAAGALEASPKVPNWIANAITEARVSLDALPAVEAAGSGPGAARAGGKLGSNLNPRHLPADVQPALDATYDANAGAIDAGRRQVIPDAQTLADAQDLANATGNPVQAVIDNWKPGDLQNNAMMVAVRNELVNAQRQAQAAHTAWLTNPSTANQLAQASADAQATKIQTVVQGLTAEMGRGLRALGIDVTDPLVLRQLADDPSVMADWRSKFQAGQPIGQAARDATSQGLSYRPTGDITVPTPQAQDMLPGLEPPGFATDPVTGASLGRPDRPFAAEPVTAGDIAALNEGKTYPVFQGSGPEFGARPDMLGAPNPDVNPNDLLNRIAAATKPVRGFQDMLKQMLVSASVFHPAVLNAQVGREFLSQGAIGQGIKTAVQADRMFLPGATAAMKDWQQANRFDLRRAENAGVTLLRGELGPDVAQTGNQFTRTIISSLGSGLAGYGSGKAQGESNEDALKQAGLFALGGAGAGALAKPLNSALWGRFVPIAKLETFKLLEQKYGAAAAATSVNNLFGGQNLAKIGRSQQVQDIFRTAVLAPDWLESWARNLDAVVKPGPEGDIARRYWATTLTAGAATMEGLNMAFNGHLTNDNEPGHHFELETTGLLKLLGQNPDRRTYLDMLELGPVGSALNAADRGDPGAFLRSHLNIIPSAGLDAVQNKASGTGKQIVPDKTPAFDAAIPEAGAAASHMVPIGLSGFQNSQVPVAQQVFSGVSGMRSSEGKAFTQDALNLYQNAGMQAPTPTSNFPITGVGQMTLTQPELRHLETMEAPVYNALAQRLTADPRWATMKPEQQAAVLKTIDGNVRPALEKQFMGQLGRDRIVQGVQDYAATQAQQRMALRARVSALPGIVGNDLSRLGAALPQFRAPAA